MKLITKKTAAAFCAALIFSSLNIYAAKGSEEDLKKQILSSANLNGLSYDEIMTDDEDESAAEKTKFGKSKAKYLPYTGDREVVYTEKLNTLIEEYFCHRIDSTEKLNFLFEEAVKTQNQFTDDYSVKVHLARCYYFYGIQLMESFDPSSLKNMDLKNAKDSVSVNDSATDYFEKAIEYASDAVKIKNGSDAYSILSHSISANCTVKNVGYILSNGLKVTAYGRTAVKLDYSNGTAHFLASAQDIYAPKPFNKAVKARKEMMSYLNNDTIRLEKYDEFNIYSAIAYSYFMKKKNETAKIWYRKCLEIYPGNLAVTNMLNKL